MSISPDVNNYTLGKGVVYFNEKDLSTGLYKGERDLGNAPSFSFNIATEKLDHYSSRGGLKVKDKSIVSQVTPTAAFTLDEINTENFAMLSMADTNEVVQTAGHVNEATYTAYIGKRIVLDYRNVGMYTAEISGASGTFTVGETITGGTSGATAEVVADGGTALTITNVSGTFTVGETITGGTSSEIATLDAIPVFSPGTIKVTDSTGATVYVAGTDYYVDTKLKDDKIGRVLIPEGSSIVDGSQVLVTFDYADVTYTEIQAFTKTQIEGMLRFVSDNPAGTQQELRIWRASISPSGDTAMIGDDWSTLSFEVEVLKDEINHPDSPYMSVLMDI